MPLETKKQSDKELSRRGPIVVVMGHIDHGKTTLLDKIRESNVAAKEFGGITQHIGAYQVEIKNQTITFIDTPGHEAFSQMRSRGAAVADLALLVVAADDGVKPQTKEAQKAIQEAKLPFIVVLNKIDKPNADPERVKKELGDSGVILEEWGGKIPAAKISAKTGEGINELMELILLMADLENLECDFLKPASGVVIESHLDSRRGNAATLLVRNGVLKKGDWVLAGDSGLKIKILEDSNGQSIEQVFAPSPVRTVGFDKTAKVGSTFETFSSREAFEKALQKETGKEEVARKMSGLEGEKIIPLVIKADVSGSLEAIENQLKKIDTRDFELTILRAAVGSIIEDDIQLASANKNSLVIGFRVKTERGAKLAAERFGVKTANFEIIYELEDWVREALGEIIGSEKIKKVLGEARVIKIFKTEGTKRVIGGKVEKGGIFQQKRFTLLRRDFPLGEGKILELQSGKIKTREISEGNEFGALVEIGLEIAPGDKFEIFDEEIIKRKL